MYGYWILSYLIGTFLTAYILARVQGIDLTTSGSGNFGARNAGRVIGKWAFVVTMLVDGLKGIVVVLVGHLLDFSLLHIAIGLLFVVVGHVFPFWHKCNGGKGVATGVGGLLFLVPIASVLLVVGFVITVLVTKSSTKGMLGAFVVYALYFMINWSEESIAVFCVLLLIVWANRHNIAERL